MLNPYGSIVVAKELSVTPTGTFKPSLLVTTEDNKTHLSSPVQDVPVISGKTDSTATPLEIGKHTQMNISPP